MTPLFCSRCGHDPFVLFCFAHGDCLAHTGLACQAEVTRELFNDTVLMPKRNLATLKYLVHFLEDVAANSEVNKYVCARVAWATHITHHTSHITHHTSHITSHHITHHTPHTTQYAMPGVGSECVASDGRRPRYSLLIPTGAQCLPNVCPMFVQCAATG